MKMGKIAVAAAAALCATLAMSCNEKKGAAPQANAKKLITVGYAQVGAESDWRLANTESFKSTFTEANGYKLIFDDAQQKQENQIKAIRNFIQQDVDYIVVAPVVETGWETVLQEAKKAGILPPELQSDVLEHGLGWRKLPQGRSGRRKMARSIPQITGTRERHD